jgi:phospholipid/cholesterol/gamma-HCH transport system substrate-binding protein
MESRANTALIGAFTLGVLALAFVFIYWLARDNWGADRRTLTIEFSGPVTGMTPGSEVLFNGINVGTVKAILQDPADPGRVIAQLSVDENQPIKEDTKASVGIQGLTGLGYMKLAGGSKDKPNLFETSGPVTLTADPAATEDLLAAAGELMGRADTILKEIEDLVKTNRTAVDASVANVQSFTEALAKNSDKIATFVDSVAGAADGITTLSKRLEGVVDKSESILAAVEPDDVRQTIAQLRETADNVSTFSKSLSDRSGDIDRMVTQFSAISSDFNAFSASLGGIGERADTLLADVGDKAGKILDAVDPEAVSRAIGNIDRIAAAIEPEKVGTTIDGLASFSQTLSNRQEDIDTLVTRLSTIASDVSGFSARLPTMGEKVDNLLAAVDTEKVTQSVDSVQQFATALGENSDDIDAIVANVRAVSERFDGLTAKAESLIAKLDDLAGGENGGIIEEASRTLTAIREAAESFDKQARAIGSGVGRFSNQGLRDLQEFVNEGRRTVSRLDRVISNLGDDPSQILFGGKGVPEYRGNRR